MIGILGGVAGVVLGFVIAWGVAAKRAQRLRDERTQALQDVAVRDAQLASTSELLEREREEHRVNGERMSELFENLSHRVLVQTMQEFSESQEQVTRERDSKLSHTLKPLEDLLDEYKRNLAEFNKEHAGALSDVKHQANQLLEAQQKSHEETRRLNQILGRGDQRGRWGEIQLTNVMEASGLRRDIDYELQVSGVSEAGSLQRPDCVVRMPNGAAVAIDAKFPFDDFEKGLAAQNDEERKSHYEEFSRKLRGHVKVLKDKSYWELMEQTPEFTVCFVPSDAAITIAFDADPTLHEYAMKQRVLVVGPTNLLSLLWSVAMVLRQHEAQLNAKEILDVAEKIANQIRLVAEPIAKMGKSLNTTVDSYNQMVKSVESRLVVSARAIRRLGGAQRVKAFPELDVESDAPVALNEAKWGTDAQSPMLDGVADIIDLEEFDDEE
jgi:DNA recombination protein RmuC